MYNRKFPDKKTIRVTVTEQMLDNAGLKAKALNLTLSEYLELLLEKDEEEDV